MIIKFCNDKEPLGSLPKCQQSFSSSPRCWRRRESSSTLKTNSLMFGFTLANLYLRFVLYRSSFNHLNHHLFDTKSRHLGFISLPFLCTQWEKSSLWISEIHVFNSGCDDLLVTYMINNCALIEYQEREYPLRLFLYILQCLHTLTPPPTCI